MQGTLKNAWTKERKAILRATYRKGGTPEARKALGHLFSNSAIRRQASRMGIPSPNEGLVIQDRSPSWTADQIATLVREYPGAAPRRLRRLFPEKSPLEIEKQAALLGLWRVSKQRQLLALWGWPDDVLDTARDCYLSTQDPAEVAAALKTYSFPLVMRMLECLGLRRPSAPVVVNSRLRLHLALKTMEEHGPGKATLKYNLEPGAEALILQAFGVVPSTPAPDIQHALAS